MNKRGELQKGRKGKGDKKVRKEGKNKLSYERKKIVKIWKEGKLRHKKERNRRK